MSSALPPSDTQVATNPGTTFMGRPSDALGERLAARVAAHLATPVAHAELFVTEACNHRCDYCFVKGKNDFHTMAPEVARAAIDYLLESSRYLNWIDVLFFGGEPLIEFGLIQEVVRYGEQRAKETGKDVRFNMTTNGTLMTEEMARFFAEHRIRYLLSIDGAQATHDAHRHRCDGTSSFESVMSRLPMMKRFQPWQGSRVTLHPDTIGNLRGDVEYLFARGINQFIIGPATGIDWPDAALAEYERQMLLVTDLYLEMQERNAPFRMTLYERDLEGEDGSAKDQWGCGAGRGRVCIGTDGALYPCAKVAGVQGLEDTHKLGDIYSGITNLALRRDYLNCDPAMRPTCSKCEHADRCWGGCPAANWEATGSIFEPSPIECRFTEIVQRIKDYYHERKPAEA